MAKNNKVEISLEEKLKQALVPVDEQPYTIPSNWVWTRLGEISKLSGGSGFPEKYQGFLEKNIPFYKVGSLKNIDDNFYVENSENYIDDDILTEIKAKLFPANTIIFAKIGEAIRLNRRAILKENSCIDNNLMALVSNSSCYFRYIYFWLKKEDLYKYAQATTVPSIRQSTLEELEFPLPPLNEQKRIVEKLDFLFEKTKRAKEIIEEIKIDIENRKISILDRAFKGTLTSKWRNDNKTSDVKELLKTINDEKIKKWEEDCLQAEKDGNKKPKKPIIKEVKDMIVPVDEQPYKLPDSWVWVRLGDIGKITSGGTPTSNEKSYYGGDIIWITPADMSKQQSSPWFSNSSKKITNLGLQKSSAQLIEGNSVVYSSRAPIGYVNIVKDKFTTSQGCKSVTPIKNSLMYIYYVLIERTEDIKYRASGTTFKEISALEFGKTLVPLPPLEEQQEIVRVLDEVLENERKKEKEKAGKTQNKNHIKS